MVKLRMVKKTTSIDGKVIKERYEVQRKAFLFFWITLEKTEVLERAKWNLQFFREYYNAETKVEVLSANETNK